MAKARVSCAEGTILREAEAIHEHWPTTLRLSPEPKLMDGSKSGVYLGLLV